MTAAAENVDLGCGRPQGPADFSLPDGRLKEIPAQRKKLDIILRHGPDVRAGPSTPKKG